MKTQTDLNFNLKPMRKILIALDYDPSAKKVAEMGYSIAKAMNAEVILLHVIADSAYYSTLPTSPIMGFGGFESTDFFQMIDVKGLKKAAEYFLDKIKNHLGDETIQLITDDGDVADIVLKTAKHFHADTIVMGSHSRKWLEQIIMGSTTERVLHQTTIPLLIIPIKEHISK
jgi:nucleotide-binding universal stress UspA family protein